MNKLVSISEASIRFDCFASIENGKIDAAAAAAVAVMMIKCACELKKMVHICKTSTLM